MKSQQHTLRTTDPITWIQYNFLIWNIYIKKLKSHYFSDVDEIARFFNSNTFDIVKFYDEDGNDISIHSETDKKFLKTLIIAVNYELSDFLDIFCRYSSIKQYTNKNETMTKKIEILKEYEKKLLKSETIELKVW